MVIGRSNPKVGWSGDGIFHLLLSFINVLPFFMVSPFVPFSTSLYFLYSFIFLLIVDTYTMMSGISYSELNMTNLCHEYFLNFLSYKTLAAVCLFHFRNCSIFEKFVM